MSPSIAPIVRRLVIAAALSGVALGGLASAGCTTHTKVTDTWRAPDYNAKVLHNVLVIAGRVEPGMRRTIEDGLVASLTERGVQARASYTLFPDALPPQAEALAVAQREQFDGVLVSQLRHVREV